MRVDQVIAELDLGNAQHLKIGSSDRGGDFVSKALKKMVTIAVELITDPGLLFLDEPTTGYICVELISSVCHVSVTTNHRPII